MENFQRPYILFLFIPLIGILLYSIHSNTFILELKARMDRFVVKKIPFPLPFATSVLSYATAFLPYISLSFLIVSAAGPGIKYDLIPDETLGVDIIIALDISGSMVNSYDFLPNNRLTVSKALLKEFISKRVEDRIGLVLFAGAAYLQSPLTSDREALKELIEEADESSIEEQGTAIGDAIMLATYRLKSSKAKSKVIVLLTDGVSNTGKMDPLSASFASKAYKLKVYSIGIGKEQGQYEVNYDSLRVISQETGGQFYRAESADDLAQVLIEIDNLEKDPLPKKPIQLSQTLFPNYLFWFFIILMIDGILKFTIMKELL